MEMQDNDAEATRWLVFEPLAFRGVNREGDEKGEERREFHRADMAENDTAGEGLLRRGVCKSAPPSMPARCAVIPA